MTINFTAKFLTGKCISTRLPNGEYASTRVSVVELDKKNKHDRKAVYAATRAWGNNGEKFGRNVYNQMTSDYMIGVEKERYIALTTQNSDFKNLRPQNMHGMMVLSTDYYDRNSILWLVADPKRVDAEKIDKPYKDLVTTLVDYVKPECKKEGITVIPPYAARDLYKALGFNDVKNSEFYEMKWDA